MQQNTATDGPDLGAKRTRIPLFSAFFMIYIFVSGGSFGIEEMSAVVRAGPDASTAATGTAHHAWAHAHGAHRQRTGLRIYPESGGFYVWTRRGLGEILGVSGGVVVVARPAGRHVVCTSS